MIPMVGSPSVSPNQVRMLIYHHHVQAYSFWFCCIYVVQRIETCWITLVKN